MSWISSVRSGWKSFSRKMSQSELDLNLLQIHHETKEHELREMRVHKLKVCYKNQTWWQSADLWVDGVKCYREYHNWVSSHF